MWPLQYILTWTLACLGGGTCTNMGASFPLVSWNRKSMYVCIEPQGCCWLSGMAIKWFSCPFAWPTLLRMGPLGSYPRKLSARIFLFYSFVGWCMQHPTSYLIHIFFSVPLKTRLQSHIFLIFCLKSTFLFRHLLT